MGRGCHSALVMLDIKHFYVGTYATCAVIMMFLNTISRVECKWSTVSTSNPSALHALEYVELNSATIEGTGRIVLITNPVVAPSDAGDKLLVVILPLLLAHYGILMQVRYLFDGAFAELTFDFRQAMSYFSC